MAEFFHQLSKALRQIGAPIGCYELFLPVLHVLLSKLQ